MNLYHNTGRFSVVYPQNGLTGWSQMGCLTKNVKVCTLPPSRPLPHEEGCALR